MRGTSAIVLAISIAGMLDRLLREVGHEVPSGTRRVRAQWSFQPPFWGLGCVRK